MTYPRSHHFFMAEGRHRFGTSDFKVSALSSFHSFLLCSITKYYFSGIPWRSSGRTCTFTAGGTRIPQAMQCGQEQNKSTTKYYFSCVHFPIFKNAKPITIRCQLIVYGYPERPAPGDTFAHKEQTFQLFLATDYPS